MFHKSVLLQEAVDGLHVAPGKVFIDGTLGGGGHTQLILERGGKVLGIDQDEEAIAFVKNKFLALRDQLYKKLIVVYGNFRNIARIARENGFERVDGVLLDVGVSSHQVDTGERGFSFLKDALLDMRMNKELGVTARDLVNGMHKGELEEIFRMYGEEPFARKIADGIVAARKMKKIETTGDLARIVERIMGPYRQNKKKSHPATKIFQALRIVVNDELRSLEEALPQAVDLLKNEGRLVVISFHSLEDRIVKRSFLNFEKKGLGRIVTVTPIIPTESEEEENRRSRSAKMRIFEKVTDSNS